MISLKTGILVASAFAGALAFVTGASAATMQCSTYVEDNTSIGTATEREAVRDRALNAATGYVGCEYFRTNGQTNTSAINAEEFFGISNWAELAKAESSGTTVPTIITSFSASEVKVTITQAMLDLYGGVMVYLKGGSNPPNGNIGTQPGADVGYAYDTAGSYTFTSPFSNNQLGATDSISNARVFGGTAPDNCPSGSFGCPPDANVVPLPAGLPLMLTVIGVGAYMRRKARKSA